jgi:hypothetical protein
MSPGWRVWEIRLALMAAGDGAAGTAATSKPATATTTRMR